MQQESFFDSAKRGFMSLPKGLRWVIFINVLVFLFMSFMDLFGLSIINAGIIRWLALSPSAIENVYQPWRLATYIFVHGSGFHILFNMLWLWWMGRPVEDTLGTRNFLVLFFGSGIGGGLLHIVLAGFFGAAPTIGASGAVFGMMVVFAMLFPYQQIMLLFLPPIQARYLVAGLIFLDVLFLNSGDNIARVVHLGGALWGYLLMKGYNQGYNYDRWVGAISSRYSGIFSSGSDSGIKSRPKNPKMRAVSDADILEETEVENQSQMDKILDKISKDGYASLSVEEKRILFELSKKK